MDSTPIPLLHLVMVELVRASLMAISAFYIHKRSVDHVIDRLIEIRREFPPKKTRPRSRLVSDEDEADEKVELEQDNRRLEVEDVDQFQKESSVLFFFQNGFKESEQTSISS